MGYSDAEMRVTPLHQAVATFAEVLGANPADFNWVADEFGTSCGDAVPIELEDNVVGWLEDMLERHFDRPLMPHQRWIIDNAHVIRPLFTVVEQVHSTERIAVLRTRPLAPLVARTGSDRLRVFARLVSTVDYPENHHNGYHLHPKEASQPWLKGKHLGYKLLFDPKRGQDWMSWEEHGGWKRPWGDPAQETLGSKQSKKLHNSALYAIRQSSRIAPEGTPFREWAATFEPVGKTAYVAHPPVACATKWPDREEQKKRVRIL